MIFRSAFLVLSLIASSAAWSSTPKGTVTVKVIDLKGQPVPGATVSFNALPGRMLLYAAPECETDSSGGCSRDDLPIDTYYVTAMKTSEGYPDLSFNLYGRKRPPIVVELTAETPTARVSFTMGPQCGKLTITAIDDSTGTPIPNRSVTMRNPSDPATLLTIGQAPDSYVLIPPDEDIQIEVVADGYEPWSLMKHAELNGGEPMRLHSDERRAMTIRLRHK